jgi:malate dehydrogenase
LVWGLERHPLTQYIQPNGAEKATNILGGVTEKEKTLLEACIKGLKGNIEKGVEFVKNPPPK